MLYNKIYQGDSLKLLEEIEDNSIDLIVCDGPYGVTENEWDKISNIQEFNLNLIKIFSRILKPGENSSSTSRHVNVSEEEIINIGSKLIYPKNKS